MGYNFMFTPKIKKHKGKLLDFNNKILSISS